MPGRIVREMLIDVVLGVRGEVELVTLVEQRQGPARPDGGVISYQALAHCAH